MNRGSSFVTTLLLAGGLFAQATNDRGFTAGFGAAFSDRLGANGLLDWACLNHFDSRSMRDWMLDPADPLGALFRPTAVRFTIQDQVGVTPEQFQVVAFNEDPQAANFPDTNPTGAGVWFRTTNLSLPPSTSTGAVAWSITVTLPATTPPSPKGDKWVGVSLLLAPTSAGPWPLDGTSLACNAPLPSAGGPRIDSVPNNNFACRVPLASGLPTGPAIYPSGPMSLRQIQIEIVGDSVGGVCVAATPSSQPGSPALPLGGTTSWAAGLHPDINNAAAAAPPRFDDIGFLVVEGNRPNAPVLVCVAFGPNPAGSVPLGTAFGPLLTPTSRGNLCIDLANSVSLFGLSTANGRFQQMLTLTPAARALISSLSMPGAPVDVWYQGFVLDLSSGLDVRASGCGIQHL